MYIHPTSKFKIYSMTQLLISEQKSHEIKMDSIDTLFTDFKWRCYDIWKTHLNDLSFSWHKHILLLLIVNCVQSFMHMKILLKYSNSVSAITLYIFSLCYFRILTSGGGGVRVSRHVFGNFTMWISRIWIFRGGGGLGPAPPPPR